MKSRFWVSCISAMVLAACVNSGRSGRSRSSGSDPDAGLDSGPADTGADATRPADAALDSTTPDTGRRDSETTPDTSVRPDTAVGRREGETCDVEVQDCATGLGCYPEGDGAAYRCARAGSLRATQVCEGNADCEPGVLCIATNSSPNAICATVCDLDTGVECAGGETCINYDDTVGACATLCTFGRGDCGGSRYCWPVGRNADLELEGLCMAGGPVAPGGSCIADICRADGICFDGVCEGTCDPYLDTSLGSCLSSEGCQSLFVGDSPVPVGACLPSCDPWENDGCAVTEQCFPLPYQVGKGGCGDLGFTEVGDGCDSDVDCVEGSICLESTCVRFCNPVAAEGDPGYCAGCVELEDFGFGTCPE